jgi:hypothetical protein
MGRYYILRNGEVVEEPDYQKWSAWFESDFQEVELVAESRLGTSTVSTRFLALDMTLSQDSPPLVFETRVKGGWLDNQWERFASLEEAAAGHESWVERVQQADQENSLPPPGAGW